MSAARSPSASAALCQTGTVRPCLPSLMSLLFASSAADSARPTSANSTRASVPIRVSSRAINAVPAHQRSLSPRLSGDVSRPEKYGQIFMPHHARQRQCHGSTIIARRRPIRVNVSSSHSGFAVGNARMLACSEPAPTERIINNCRISSSGQHLTPARRRLCSASRPAVRVSPAPVRDNNGRH